jgi:hypothetical protein
MLVDKMPYCTKLPKSVACLPSDSCAYMPAWLAGWLAGVGTVYNPAAVFNAAPAGFHSAAYVMS